MNAASIALAIVAVFLPSCASTPTSAQLIWRSGPPPPASHQEEIKALLLSMLKDPGSAKFQFHAPEIHWFSSGDWLRGWTDWYGWRVPVLINARNSFGGYTGFQNHSVLFQNGEIVGIEKPSGPYSGPDYTHRVTWLTFAPWKEPQQQFSDRD
jgi:hypothetical protein